MEKYDETGRDGHFAELFAELFARLIIICSGEASHGSKNGYGSNH